MTRSSGTRDISVTAKFSAAEFARLESVMGGKRPGTWAYEQMLAAIERAPLEEALLAELVALRQIVLNFYHASLSGKPLEFDVAAAHVKAADLEKLTKARALLRRVM